MKKQLSTDYESGFTLIETIVALGIVGVVLVASTSAFIYHLRSNHEAELRYEGAQAAQTVIDDIRYIDIDTLPASGTDDPRHITMNGTRTYDVYVTYCSDPTYCTSEDVRQLHLLVEHDGEKLYETETIFTALEKGYGQSVGNDDEGAGPTPTPTATPTATPTPTPTATPTPIPTSTPTPTPTPKKKKCKTWKC
ncbi:MAG: type II secretion system protein [Bdellovibrionales bacterium]|nr:type II secretion system protein [Bdellovibrionales bacterium]